MTTSSDLRAQVTTTKSALAEAEARAVTASPAELADVGAMIAGLRAKLTGLEGQLADALAAEAHDAQLQAARTAAEARDMAICAVGEKQAELSGRLDAFMAGMVALEDQAIALWGEFYAVQDGIRELAAEAAALGVQAPVLVEPGERARKIAAGRSVYIRWQPAQRHGLH